MTDGFQHRRAPVAKRTRPSTARLLFAIGIPLAGIAPFFVMAGFPFLDGDFSRILELVPVVFFGGVVFLILRFAKKGEASRPYRNDYLHGHPDYESTFDTAAYEMRHPRYYSD